MNKTKELPYPCTDCKRQNKEYCGKRNECRPWVGWVRQEWREIQATLGRKKKKMTISPCKNCPDRNAKCHTVCERYKEFKEQTHEEYVQRFRENEIESYEIRRGRRLFNGKRRKHEQLH